MDRQDLVIIGGGTSGFIVAMGALRLGLKVTLIERSHMLGGSALHFGCIPSKAFLHAAKISVDKNLSVINSYVTDIVNNINAQDIKNSQATFRQMGGIILYGQPKFIDHKTISLNNNTISAKKFIIATGSHAIYPTIKGLDEVGYITSDQIYTQEKLPAKLIVIGDKPAAIEFAQAFINLGSSVIIIVNGDTILPSEEPEFVAHMQDMLVRAGVKFYFNTTVDAAYTQKQQKFLECTHASGEKLVISADEVLVSLGRRPNVESLSLENAGIKYTQAGIIVNKNLRTSRKNIYALGDVILSPYKLTHAAEYQASIVLSNAVFRYPARVKYQGFPYVIFTTPEYAHVGLSEQQAREQGYKKLDILRFDFKDLDSAIIQNSTVGLIKIVAHKQCVIGATIFGPQASNLIAEWGLAINLGAKVTDVATTIHAYPTLAQINRRVASKYAVKNMFSVRMQRFVRCLQQILA